MNIKKIGSIVIAVTLLASPLLASAETATTSTNVNTQIQTMLLQIQTLQAQLKSLQSLQAQIASTTQSIYGTMSLIRNLKQGMTGEDVKALQAVLAADPTIYSGEITGFFGKMTAEAVKKYQEKNGIDAVGSVGPKTLKKLNEQAEKLGLSRENKRNNEKGGENRKEGDKKENTLCVKVPPGQMIAPGWIKKDGPRTDAEERAEIAARNNTIIPPCKDLPKGIDDKINGENHGTVTPRDTTAPVISSVGTSNILATTTNIVWTTNENSNSRVWFGTTNPVNYKADPNIRTGDLFVTNHVIPLSGLSTSTTYYFVVGSIDPFNNSATSSQGSFTTLAQ